MTWDDGKWSVKGFEIQFIRFEMPHSKVSDRKHRRIFPSQKGFTSLQIFSFIFDLIIIYMQLKKETLEKNLFAFIFSPSGSSFIKISYNMQL